MKKSTKSDYDQTLGDTKYTGQIERCFDQDGEETYHCASAKKILRWSKRGKKIGYFPK